MLSESSELARRSSNRIEQVGPSSVPAKSSALDCTCTPKLPNMAAAPEADTRRRGDDICGVECRTLVGFHVPSRGNRPASLPAGL